MADPTKFRELMASVGTALHGWSQVESCMELLFATVSGIPSARKAGAMFGAMAFEARLAVLDTAMELNDHLSVEEKEVWECVSARLRKLYRKRHEVAHFLVPTPDEMDAGERISPFFTWDKYNRELTKYLTIPQLEERSSKFTRAAQAVSWFTNLVIARTQHGFHSPLPEAPQLIVHIRELLARKKEEQPQPPQPSAA